MSDGTYIGGAKLPPVSREFLAELEKAFPGPTVKVGFDRDQAVWDAATKYVVDWIKHHAGRETKQTDPVAEQRARVRLGS